MDGDAVFREAKQTISTSKISSHLAPAESRLGLNGVVSQDCTSTGQDDRRAHPVLSGLIKWIDSIALVLTTVLAASVGNHSLSRGQMAAQAAPDLGAVILFVLLCGPVKLPLPRFQKRAPQQLMEMAPALLAASLVQAGIFWWLGWSIGALAWESAVWMTMTAGGQILSRSLSACVLRRPAIEQKLRRKIAIIGYGTHALRLAERCAAAPHHGIKVAGIYDDDVVPSVTGSVNDLIAAAGELRLDAIIIALPPARGHEGEIASLTWRLRSVAADVFVMPYLIHGPDILLPLQYLGATPVMVLQRRPLNVWQAICKKVFDITLSLAALMPFLLIFALVAVAIKLDSEGPVLFRQPRRGRNNAEFTMLKFRSMYASATDVLSLKQTSRGDPRVTRVGKWLRRLSIDELPQIINVLRGDMSLVGPRPHAPLTRVEGMLLDDVIVDYVMRYKVKPGITGWAQVNGSRGQLVKSGDLLRRVTYDLEYIQRWSMGLDLKIIFLTALREIFSKHAF